MRQELSGVCADHSYSYRDLEEFAADVRKRLGYSPMEAINPLQLFDGLSIRVKLGTGKKIPIRGGVMELGESEGYVKYDKGRRIIEILASPQTYKWLEIGYPRGGFFVAHELGHCLLHTEQLVRLAKMPKSEQAALHRGRRKVDHKAYQDTEWQANAFAAALLMPARGLLELERSGELSLDIVAEHFHVSDQAATYRLDSYNKRKKQLL